MGWSKSTSKASSTRRDALRLRPCQAEGRVAVLRRCDPGIGTRRGPIYAADHLLGTKERDRRFHPDGQVAPAGSPFGTPEVEDLDADVPVRLLSAAEASESTPVIRCSLVWTETCSLAIRQ